MESIQNKFVLVWTIFFLYYSVGCGMTSYWRCSDFVHQAGCDHDPGKGNEK